MEHLALVDAFIVTAISVSMLSEACTTGKLVYVIAAERCKWNTARRKLVYVIAADRCKWNIARRISELNPHMGHLASADAFIVTTISVSMLSEACTTRKLVYAIAAERCKWNIARRISGFSFIKGDHSKDNDCIILGVVRIMLFGLEAVWPALR
ncbi:mitochondrial fission protein ELM1 [Tanacetum coccineum]